MLSMRQAFRKAPFKSYHFPCLFRVVWRSQGSSLHTQDLKKQNEPTTSRECSDYFAQILSWPFFL